MKFIWTRYVPSYPKAILYMLQASEYGVSDYLNWLHRTSDFRSVAHRKTLDITQNIKLLAIAMIALSITIVTIGVVLYIQGGILAFLGIVIVILLPWMLSYLIIAPLLIGKVFIQKPSERRMKAIAHQQLAAHDGVRIAIAGSFGKTTAKEILATILAEGKKVASTPGNMNTTIGTSKFIQSLDGNEEVIVFELGESHVGDIKELAELVRPDIGIITGINEAHLSTFGTIENTIATIFELQDFLGRKPLYKNSESKYVADVIQPNDPYAYSVEGVGGWKISDIRTSLRGTEFCIQKDVKVVWVKTKLIGTHTVGVLSACIAIADTLGLSTSQIASGLKKVAPFEHRMQPKELHGAWVIDDTYNGNIEGVKAGLSLLKDSEAKRRIYVTPGLVEQGGKTQEIHEEIGRRIATSADVVVLMKNSVTDHIAKGLSDANFAGSLTLIDDPLDFYTNLEHFVVDGDVVLMQNDWTDNYA